MEIKLTRAQAYNLHAEFRIQFEMFKAIHKQNMDETTFNNMVELIHDVIKKHTKPSDKKE